MYNLCVKLTEIIHPKNIVQLLTFHFRYGTGTLTDVFLDRVFQECLTYEGEMVRYVVVVQFTILD